jgi:hypothetical protein
MVILGGVPYSDPWALSLTGPPFWTSLQMVVTARPDAYTGNEDRTLHVGPPGILSNDVVARDHDAATAALSAEPKHGALSLQGNGSFSYRPEPDYNGNDGFTYVAHSGDYVSAPVKVTLKIQSVPDPPVAHDDSYTTSLNTTLSVDPPGLLENDVNRDGNSMRAAFLSGEVYGNLDLRSDGSFTFTPWTDRTEGARFFYRVTTNSGSDVGYVGIAVVH